MIRACDSHRMKHINTHTPQKEPSSQSSPSVTTQALMAHPPACRGLSAIDHQHQSPLPCLSVFLFPSLSDTSFLRKAPSLAVTGLGMSALAQQPSTLQPLRCFHRAVLEFLRSLFCIRNCWILKMLLCSYFWLPSLQPRGLACSSTTISSC